MHPLKKTKLDLDDFVEYYDYESDFLRLAHGLDNAGYLSSAFVYTVLDATFFKKFKDEPHYTNAKDPLSGKPFVFGITADKIKEGMEQGHVNHAAHMNLADYCEDYEHPAIVLWDADKLENSFLSHDQFYFRDFEKRHGAVSHFLDIKLPDGS